MAHAVTTSIVKRRARDSDANASEQIALGYSLLRKWARFVGIPIATPSSRVGRSQRVAAWRVHAPQAEVGSQVGIAARRPRSCLTLKLSRLALSLLSVILVKNSSSKLIGLNEKLGTSGRSGQGRGRGARW